MLDSLGIKKGKETDFRCYAGSRIFPLFGGDYLICQIHLFIAIKIYQITFS